MYSKLKLTTALASLKIPYHLYECGWEWWRKGIRNCCWCSTRYRRCVGRLCWDDRGTHSSSEKITWLYSHIFSDAQNINLNWIEQVPPFQNCLAFCTTEVRMDIADVVKVIVVWMLTVRTVVFALSALSVCIAYYRKSQTFNYFWEKWQCESTCRITQYVPVDNGVVKDTTPLALLIVKLFPLARVNQMNLN